MKKTLAIFLTLAFIAMSGIAFAAVEAIKGRLKSVDAGGSRIEISNVTESTWLSYDQATKWPEGITNPMLLVGKDIKANMEAGKLLSVEED